MTLLDPITSIVTAVIALPLLVVFFLLKLRRRQIRVSSVLFWTRSVLDLQANVPLRWLRISLLFFLHLLILALLVLAIGRPVGRGMADESRLVLLIDCSASMSATDARGGVSRLDEAKRRAAERIAELNRGTGGRAACVVAFASEPAAITPFTASPATLRDAIDAIRPTDQPADPAAAIRLVDTLLRTGEEEDNRRAAVVLLSDGGFPADQPLSLAGSRLVFDRIGPAKPPDNLGIVALAARRDYDDPITIRVFARVRNASDAPISSPISLALGGRIVETRLIEFPAATPPQPAMGVSDTTIPESSAVVSSPEIGVSFEFGSREGGVLTLALGREDSLRSDNTASLVLDSAKPPSIILIKPGPTATTDGPPPLAAETLLDDALSELKTESLRIISQTDAATVLASDSITRVDLIIFDRVMPSKLPGVPTMSFGASIPLPGLSARTADDRPTRALTWNRSHPVMRDVALDTLFVSRTIGLVAADDRGVRVTELARGGDGPLMLVTEESGIRRVVVGFELAQSNWPVDVSFPIFLANAVDYLTLRGESSSGLSFRTNEPARLRLKPGLSTLTSPLKLRGPETIDVTQSSDGIASAGVLKRAGVYAVEGHDSFDRIIAINLMDSVETSLASPDNISLTSGAVQAAEGSAGRELWFWFVLAAAALLVVEWFVFGWRMRV